MTTTTENTASRSDLVRDALRRITRDRPDLRHDFLQRKTLAERAVDTGEWPEEVPIPQAPKCLGLDYGTALRADRTVLELRSRKLSHAAMVTVLDLYEGWTLTEHQVSYWLDKLGAPKNPNKTRRAVAA